MKMKKEVWVSISLVETAPAVAMGSLELVDKEERCPRGQAAAQQRILHCQQLQQVRANWSPGQGKLVPSPVPHPCGRYRNVSVLCHHQEEGSLS